MTAYTLKTELGFKLPEMLSYHSTWDDADYEPVLPPRRPGLRQRLAALGESYRRRRQCRAAMSELSDMSDRELADIGITRYDIPRVCTQEFAREHAERWR